MAMEGHWGRPSAAGATVNGPRSGAAMGRMRWARAAWGPAAAAADLIGVLVGLGDLATAAADLVPLLRATADNAVRRQALKTSQILLDVGQGLAAAAAADRDAPAPPPTRKNQTRSLWK